MSKQDKKKIDYKYNIKKYWELTKGSKGLIFGIILSVILAEIVSISNSFLYKKFVDASQKFISQEILKIPFVKEIISSTFFLYIMNFMQHTNLEN
jgi:hypothetical protein